MKNLALILTLLMFNFSNAQGLSDFFAKTAVFLKQHVDHHKVAYSVIQKNKTELEILIQQIATTDLTNENEESKKAFFINAYNLIMIKSIVEKYPVKSPLDISGVFDKNQHEIAGMKLTLNDLENKMLRAKYNDARIHFVLVCGANGCPPITNFAYVPEKLENQLNEQTKAAINNPSFIKINTSSKKISVSQIFEWYKDDFITKNSSLITFLNAYLSSPIDEKYRLSYYNYDWSLNELK
ncbi:DUF547 domain-containing protein [Polaribacter sp. BAL334]|uniref:DUF547 domain-containing protein n=1 Tax=Polaribacter sp. BAL334 TaxID=1708178 RepID=UPI001E33137B|nr:DUF547 domain-containing protein [Polaribacter sp. BAL334]